MGGNRLARYDVAGAEFAFYANNHLGAPLIMARFKNATGPVLWEAIYKPFGEAEVSPHSTETNNFRFAGQYYDEETGLHYNWHRYYDPKTGRYLTPDPSGLAGGINLYSYVLNDPVNFTDPLGLWTLIIGGSASIQGVGAVGADVGYAIGYSKEKGFTHGPVGSVNAGLGTPSGFAGGFFQWTNARSLDDLKGFSVQLGGGVDLGVAVGADYIAGLDTSSYANMVAGPTYEGFQINVGAGFSPVIAEIHALLGGSIAAPVFGKEQGPCEPK